MDKWKTEGWQIHGGSFSWLSVCLCPSVYLYDDMGAFCCERAGEGSLDHERCHTLDFGEHMQGAFIGRKSGVHFSKTWNEPTWTTPDVQILDPKVTDAFRQDATTE